MKLSRNIGLYYINQALSGLIFTLPIWVAFQHRYLSYIQMSWLQSVAFIIAILLQLPTGAFANVFGRKKAIMLGWLIAGTANIFVGFSTNILTMIIGLLMVAIGTTFVSGADTAILYDTLKQLGKTNEFPKINARGLLFYRLSMIFAIFFGGYLYQTFIGLPIICKGVSQLLIIGAALFMLEPTIDSEKFTTKKYFARIKTGITNLFANTNIKLLSIYYILVGGISWSCLYYLVNTFAKDIGYTELGQSWLFSILYIISTSAILFITEHKTLLQKYKSFVYIAFPVIMMLGLLPGVFATKLTGAMMLLLLVFIGGSRFAVLDGLINEEFSSEARATTLSTLNLMVQFLTAVIIFVNGPIQERFTTKPMFTILGIATILLVLPLGILISKRTKQAV